MFKAMLVDLSIAFLTDLHLDQLAVLGTRDARGLDVLRGLTRGKLRGVSVRAGNLAWCV